jgi:protein-S-isoprenylcysteine O-methyltransferase Ste14
VQILSVLGYILIMLGLLGLWRTGSLLAHHPLLIAAQIAAVALMVWARFTFGLRSFHLTANPTAGGLVTNGPYRYIRHPIYASICLFTLAGVIGHFTVLAFVFMVVVVAGAIIRITSEEHLLIDTYPDYRQYSKQTYRIVPGVY